MNEKLLEETLKVMELLKNHTIHVWIYGSFAVSLYAGKWIKEHDDVDLAFESVEDYKSALKVAVENGYNIENEFSWNGREHEGLAWNAVVYTPKRGKFDFSFIKNEVDVSYQHSTKIQAFGYSFKIFSLRDLLSIYKERGEKKDDVLRIQMLEALIAKNE